MEDKTRRRECTYMEDKTRRRECKVHGGQDKKYGIYT
jgi:hypothetical protein